MSTAKVLIEIPASESVADRAKAAPDAEDRTCGQILKSSALVGGSSAINIVIGIVRTKAIALMLGPAGFGLFGLYSSIASLAQTLAGMGINSSGVRQIAEAVGTSDTNKIDRTTFILRRASLLLGLLGAAVLFLASGFASRVTFGDDRHTGAIRLLSLAVLLALAAAGQCALLQGMRRISDLAKVAVAGAAGGTVLSICLVYFLRDKGIVPALIAVAAATLVSSWWYSRRLSVSAAVMDLYEVRRQVAPLLKLGFAFMSSQLMTLGVAYVVRLVILRKVGVEATGLYQSAWTIGGLYVGFILQAMGADFYPRLTAQAKNNTVCNRLVNEQTHVGLLLAGPGILATLTFAPLVITMLYSAKFGAAVEVLRWICLGSLLQVVTWPMGFIIIAKGHQTTFFSCELAWTLVNLLLGWVCIHLAGLTGAGIAFFGSYLFHGLMLYPVVHRLSGFRWSATNQRLGLAFSAVIAAVFVGFHVIPFAWAVGFGAVSSLLCSVYALRVVLTLVSIDRIPSSIANILRLCGLAPARA